MEGKTFSFWKKQGKAQMNKLILFYSNLHCFVCKLGLVPYSLVPTESL